MDQPARSPADQRLGRLGRPVRLVDPPVRLKGWVCGLPQPPLTGTVAICLPDRFAFPVWAARLGEVIGAESALVLAELSPSATDRSAAVQVLDLLLSALQALLRSKRIPVSRAVHVTALGTPSDEPADARFWRYAVCSPSAAVSSAVLRWLVDAANEAMLGLTMPAGIDNASEASTHRKDSLAERGRVLFERLKPFAANGLNLFPMVDAALDLGIEVRRLTGRVISLGVGARSRLFDSTLSDRTPSIGVQLARSKMMCNEVLRAAGLPAPPQQVARSPEDAIKASQTLGFPVVIKPVDRDRGEGVAADLRSSNAVRVAYAAAAAYSTEILVERHIPGSTHRLTVWDGRVVRVTRRITAGVTGDGVSSVEQLIERLREDPVHKRRAERMGKVLIELDDEAQSLLGQQGLTARSVPAAGQRVRLRRRDNINAGGINEQIPLDRVHPDNVALALRAARILRLDIAGIDYITEDVSQSWMDCGGGICEVNAQPQIGISDTPDLYHRLLLEAMPDLGRIPIELHVYAEDPPPVPPESSEPARFNSRACSRSLEIDGAIVLANPPAVFDAIRHALLDPAVRGLLAGMPLSELQAHGSPARWIDLIVAHVPAGWPSRQRQALMEDLQHRFRGHAAGFVLKGD